MLVGALRPPDSLLHDSADYRRVVAVIDLELVEVLEDLVRSLLLEFDWSEGFFLEVFVLSDGLANQVLVGGSDLPDYPVVYVQSIHVIGTAVLVREFVLDLLVGSIFCLVFRGGGFEGS